MADETKKKKEYSKSPISLREEAILKFWQENKIFEKSEAKAGKEFIFYDGPPFATGLPHHGHILAGTIKDAIPRYQTMRGKKVSRRWGWDCHGLPLENIIERELNLKTKKDIEIFGIGKFNEAAEKAVLRYADDWKKIVPRMGRWINMEDAYKTMDATYTESVWWAFKTLYDKKLIYQGFKGMQLCPRCETTLSNFEVAQGYKDISDLAVTVKLELKDEPGTFLLAWTTTPWTLPGNMAAGVNPDLAYVRLEKDGLCYIVAKEKISIVEGAKVLEEFRGKMLVGKSYIPPFDYYRRSDIQNKENAWKVYGAKYVTAEDGTGVVHLAPAYGTEDLELAEREKIPIVHHVGSDGAFKKEVSDFAGLQAKPKEDHQSSDVLIIKNLSSRGILFAKEKINHSYPHCWRCDTPLLNYAATSWFVSVTKIKDKLIKENNKIKWVPKHIGSKRFNNILGTAPDWAISRSRFWGAPLPVWQCSGCESRTVIGSLSELKKSARRNGNHFYVIRHGEADSNIKKVCSSGEDDSFHLTEKGTKQAQELGRKFNGKKIGAIYTSSLIRAKETADIIAGSIGFPKNKIIVDKRISELNFGSFNGKPYKDFLEYEKEHMYSYDAKIPGGESYLDAKKRFGDFVYELEGKYKDSQILVISHGVAAETIEAVLEGANDRRSREIIKNNNVKEGGVYEFEFYPIPHNEKYELDFHRPHIDKMELSCECGEDLKRVPEVFDCWFESGSMPYGQFHYPFEKKRFDPPKGRGYPADFISESLDQTRGWFYSLLVLGVALFGRAPYRNVITNGLVLAEDGQKMSKKLKNYPDPVDVVNLHGADSLRYYLLSSQLIRGEDLNFSEKGIAEISNKIISRLENVLSFYELYRGGAKSTGKSKNILDRWIMSRFFELSKEATEAMDVYELDRATRPILSFVDDLSTWYIRRSRERFRGSDESDKNFALVTTEFVMRELSKLLAPFMPFLAEHVFLKLRNKNDKKSVHLESWPKSGKVDQGLLKKMEAARAVVSLGLEARAKKGIKVRQPLRSLSIKDKNLLKDKEILKLIMGEMNVKEVLLHTGNEDVSLDTLITPELRLEGIARDLVREIQDKRKDMNLKPSDRVVVYVKTTDPEIKNFLKYIEKTVNANKVEIDVVDGEQSVSVERARE